MSVRIYTDASSNLFHSILEKKCLDITVLPMTLTLNNKEYYLYDQEVDVEEMSKTFYEDMKKGAKPRTSLTSPGLFKENEMPSTAFFSTNVLETFSKISPVLI